MLKKRIFYQIRLKINEHENSNDFEIGDAIFKIYVDLFKV